MHDLIERQAAIDALGKEGLITAMVIVDRLPSAEPEIIRCKDCRFYQDNNGGYPHMNCKWDANETPDEDDFCSGAERKDAE